MDKSKKSGHSYDKFDSILDGRDEIRPDLTKLHVYTQTKLALAGQLRIVRESLIALAREKAE